MNRHSIFLILVLCSANAAASMTASHTEGKVYANQRLEPVKNAARTTKEDAIPKFKNDYLFRRDITEEKIGDSVLLGEILNPAFDFVKNESCTPDKKTGRIKIKIDPETDPLFKVGNKAIENPKKTIEEEFEVKEETASTDTYETCEEGGGEYIQNCMDTYNVVLSITQAQEEKRSCPQGGTHSIKKKNWGGGIRHIDCPDKGKGGCQVDRPAIPKSVRVVSEGWVDGCDALEKLVEDGVCSYESLEKGPPETRNISGESISRPSFYTKKTYRCLIPIQNTCKPLAARGCIQVASECKEKQGDACIVWKQTYKCKNTKTHIKTSGSRGRKLFCLSGDCERSSYEANTELFEAMSHLSVLREAQQNIRDGVTIFKGKDTGCSRDCLNFKDCCGNGKGWGVSTHLAKCTPEEQDLRKQRDLGRCVMVGTYCSNKKPVVGCLAKKTTFCCFPNKLSRIIQEQGRKQLGISWGNANSPYCEGLTPEQLSKLDFSKIDFSEFHDEIKEKLKAKDKSDGVPITDRLKDTLKTLKPGKPAKSLIGKKDPL